MPGPFLSSQYRTAKKARASASPSKPSASSSRLDAGRSSLGAATKTPSKTTSAGSSSLLSGKSTSKSNAANALRAKVLLGKVHSSSKPSTTKPRLDLNSGPGISRAQLKELADNAEKARKAALQDGAKSKKVEKAKDKANETMPAPTNARQSSSSAASGPAPNTRQNATAPTSSHPAPPASAPIPAQSGAGGAPMYHASSSYPHTVYPQLYPPLPPPFVPPTNANTRRASAPNGHYDSLNTIPSPVDAPAAMFTFRANAPATAATPVPQPTALVNIDLLRQDLTALYHAQDQLFRSVGSVLQVQEAHGRMIQGMQGQCATLLASRDGDQGQKAGLDTLVKEIQEEREEQKRWRESQAKLFGEFATVLTSTRKTVEGVDKRLGKPKGERDVRSLFDRMESVEWGIGEIGLILGDPEANMPEGTDPIRPSHQPQSDPSQQDAGPSTVILAQLNTRDEPIEIDLEESPSASSPDPPSAPIEVPFPEPQVVPPQEPEQQLPSVGSSSSSAPDLHALLDVNTQVLPQSSQTSGMQTPDGTCDFDLEYPPDNSQPVIGSQRRRSKTPEPSPMRIAPVHDDGEEKGEETQAIHEDRSKTPEPEPIRAALTIQKTPTQASILASSSTSTLATSSSTGTTLSTSTPPCPAMVTGARSTSTCSLDKSTQHFSRVDWTSADANPTISTTSPYKPDAETLSKTPIEKRVSSTLPPPPEGSVAELRLGVVGCAPYVGRGLTLDQNDQLVVEGPGGHTDNSEESAHIPVVTRPSVSPLPSPATTPNQSRAVTPAGKRSESVDTQVLEEEEDGMQVDDGAARGEGTPMQVDGARRADPTLDILARNLREVHNLEEERKRIEVELAREKVRKEEEDRREAEEREKEEGEAREKAEREEGERKRKEQAEREEEERKRKEQAEREEEERKWKEEAEARRRAEEAMLQAEKERVENEVKARQLERQGEEQRKRIEELEREAARAEAQAKEKAEKDKREADLAEAKERELKRVEEAERKEREKRERERLTREKEALTRREEMERFRAQVDKEEFEREAKERREAIERETKARLLAEAEQQRKGREEEENREAQQEQGTEVLENKPDNLVDPQEEEPVQDDEAQNSGYDLDFDLEPESGIDPIYTQLGGPTPAPSHPSIEPSLSPEIMPASSSALPRLQLGRALTAVDSIDVLSAAESVLSTSQEGIEIPDEIDDQVDTSDEGELDELHNDLEVDQLISSPIIAASSFIVDSTPQDPDSAPTDPVTASGAAQVEERAPQPTQNRTITYTPKSFKGGKSQPLLEIVNNSPQRGRSDVGEVRDGEKMSSKSVSETPVLEEEDGLRSEAEVVGLLPPTTSSPSASSVGRQRSDSVGETKVATASAIQDLVPDDTMDQELPESPQEQLFLPGDDDSGMQTPQPIFLVASQQRRFPSGDDSDGDEPPLSSSKLKSGWSHPTQSRLVSEEVPEATSTPRPKAVPNSAPPAPETITKGTSTSTSSSMQYPPITPTRSRVHSGMSTPIHLSTGSGLRRRLDSHPASRTLVPTPSRRGALSRRLEEEESRSRERSNSVTSSIAVNRRNAQPLPSTPTVKPTIFLSTSTSTKGKKTPVVTSEIIEITSSPEASPRTAVQNMIDKRRDRLEARKRESKMQDGNTEMKVKSESEGGRVKGRASNAADIVIDLTSDKDEDDEAGGKSSKAKGKGKQSTKETEDDFDSDPPIDGDSDDSTEVVSAAPVRRSLLQGSRAGVSSSRQPPTRSITDRINQKNKPGSSAAATRLKRPAKRPKDGESDGDDRPMKRARDEKASKGSFVPVIGTVKARPISALNTSGSSKGSDKGKRKERDDDGDSVVVKRERISRAMGNNARDSSTTSTVASGSKNRDSVNAKTLRQRTLDLEAEPVKWPPANKHGNRKFQRDFIECDMCNGWYHYGCVGIKEDDPRIRLQDLQSFMCPRCEMGLAIPQRTKEEKERCGRPNCTQRAPKSNEYYVERLVGRKYSGTGVSYSWLVKWDGYPLDQSTWQTEKDMTEPMKLIEAFVEVAEKEGKDLSNPYRCVLLNEVEKSGWVDPDK